VVSCAVVDTLEKRLTVMHRVAKRYASHYDHHVGRFEEDELVNQMWLSPRVRKAQFEHHVARAALNALFSYFRHEIKRHNHEHLESYDCHTEILLDLLKMDMEELIRDMTRTQKLIIKLRCERFTLDEIAKVVGVAGESSVRKHLSTIDKERFKQWIAA